MSREEKIQEMDVRAGKACPDIHFLKNLLNTQ
jgi:hypothetical protein